MVNESSAVSNIFEIRGDRRAMVPPPPASTRDNMDIIDLDDKDVVDITGADEITDLVEAPPVSQAQEAFEREFALMESWRQLDLTVGAEYVHPKTIASCRRLTLLACTDEDRAIAWAYLAYMLDVAAGFSLIVDGDEAEWMSLQSGKELQLFDQAFQAIRRALTFANTTNVVEHHRLIEQLVRHLRARRDPDLTTQEILLGELRKRLPKPPP